MVYELGGRRAVPINTITNISRYIRGGRSRCPQNQGHPEGRSYRHGVNRRRAGAEPTRERGSLDGLDTPRRLVTASRHPEEGVEGNIGFRNDIGVRDGSGRRHNNTDNVSQRSDLDDITDYLRSWSGLEAAIRSSADWSRTVESSIPQPPAECTVCTPRRCAPDSGPGVGQRTGEYETTIRPNEVHSGLLV